MSVFTYGVIDIGVHALTREVSAENLREGEVDRLATRYTFHVAGVINPKAISYVQNVGAPPTPLVDQSAATTFQAIREALGQDRQQLVYSWAGNTVFRSPAINLKTGLPYPCDVVGGPKVLRPPEVYQVAGDKTILVRLSVETVINESYLNTATVPVLLSNRWETEDRYDECAFRTIVYKGRAVFRADVLNTLVVNGTGAVPDDFRDWIANFTIPPGFQREQVWVKQDETGFGLNYQVVDVQQPVTLTDQRAMKVQAVWDSEIESTSLEEYFEESALDLGDTIINTAGLLSGGHPGDALASVFKAFTGSVRKGVGSLPRSSEALLVTVRGHPGSNRKDLATVAYVTAIQMLGGAATFQNTATWAATHVRLRKDGFGKYVQLLMRFRRGPFQTAFSVFGGNGVPNLIPNNPDDGVPGISTAAPGATPPFPGNGGVRGTSLEQLVRAALLNPFTVPAKPPSPRQAGQGLTPTA